MKHRKLPFPDKPAMVKGNPQALHVADYWSLPAAAALTAVRSHESGLTAREAADRRAALGDNHAGDQPGVPPHRLLLRQFQSPLVLVLLFGAMVSLGLRDWVDASIILAIVLGSCALGFVQEYRASTAVAELRSRLALRVQVLRDGVQSTIPASGIVPGDIVRLSAGMLVPCDGLVLAAKDFMVSESALTGESYPVEKQPGTVAVDALIAARTNCVHMGTSVRSGTATVLVMETGSATAYGAIAARLEAAQPETEFARGIRQFGYMLLKIMLVMVLFVLAVNHALGRPVIESLLFAVALAVGLSPELLPAIVSITLSLGARAMAREGVIVRRLEAIENLGSMDVLCVDKTGTLTEGVVALNGAVDPDGNAAPTVLRYAYLNASLETGIDNPLDAAIEAHARTMGMTHEGAVKVDEIPYDFHRRRLTVVIVDEASTERHRIITKGAYDHVLPACTRLQVGEDEQPLDAASRQRLDEYHRRKSTEGYRVLAVAVKLTDPRQTYTRDDETDMTFAGFILFFDPPKKSAHDTIAALALMGIDIRIITGDNRYVAQHVAREIGLADRGMLTGREIASMKEEALWHRAGETNLFVEVDPQQKARIVRALQKTGHAVGFMGDGINDAPALHAADVGISVDSAVDVARESADVVLLRPDLAVLKRGVEDGRRTFANTLKYISITTSANFGNMVSMALATPLLPFLPLLAKQILLNNFLSDLPSLAISTDNVDAERTATAQRWDIGQIWRYMLVFGLISTVFDLMTFMVLLRGFDADEREFQTVWFVVSLLTELVVVLVLRTHGPALASRPSRLLGWSTVAISVIAIAIPYVPAIATVFGFAPIPAHLLWALAAIIGSYVLATEVAKRLFFRVENRRR